MSSKPPETLEQAIKEFKMMIAEMPHILQDDKSLVEAKTVIMQRVIHLEYLINKEINKLLN